MGGSAGHLEGVRVLDLGIWRPVPYATQLLADLGADVVKVEPPGGDPMRAFVDLFPQMNGWKRSVVADLKSDEGRRRVLDLAAEADVVTEGFRPGVADRLGVGWDAVRAVNPRAVYCSVSGFGQTGPLRDVPGHDLSYQAVAGALGEPPVVPKVPIGDLAAAMAAAFAICAALVGRARTGEGERIDVSMTDVVATWVGTVEGATLDGVGKMGGSAGYGAFATADGRWVALSTITEDHFWTATCTALGLTEEAALPLVARQSRTPQLREAIATAIAKLTRDEAVDLLGAAGAPVAPVHSQSEAIADPHLRHRGAFTTDPEGRPSPGHPVVFTNRPARPPGPAPRPGDADDGGFGAR